MSLKTEGQTDQNTQTNSDTQLLPEQVDSSLDVVQVFIHSQLINLLRCLTENSKHIRQSEMSFCLMFPKINHYCAC